METTSNFGDLFAHETRVKIKRVSRVVEALLMAGALFGSGGVTGYWVATQNCKEELLIQDRQQVEEIARTTAAYKESLSYLSASLSALTGKVTQAAVTSDSAAQAAEGAAMTADKAARAAKRAATDRVPEPTRDQINRSVQRANSAIQQ